MIVTSFTPSKSFVFEAKVEGQITTLKVGIKKNNSEKVYNKYRKTSQDISKVSA